MSNVAQGCCGLAVTFFVVMVIVGRDITGDTWIQTVREAALLTVGAAALCLALAWSFEKILGGGN